MPMKEKPHDPKATTGKKLKDIKASLEINTDTFKLFMRAMSTLHLTFSNVSNNKNDTQCNLIVF
jgi:hypothetical protein